MRQRARSSFNGRTFNRFIWQIFRPAFGPVDEEGNINFPFVGNINVGGLTTSQAGEKYRGLTEYVSSSTSVIVKFVENQVTVMGKF